MPDRPDWLCQQRNVPGDRKRPIIVGRVTDSGSHHRKGCRAGYCDVEISGIESGCGRSGHHHGLPGHQTMRGRSSHGADVCRDHDGGQSSARYRQRIGVVSRRAAVIDWGCRAYIGKIASARVIQKRRRRILRVCHDSYGSTLRLCEQRYRPKHNQYCAFHCIHCNSPGADLFGVSGFMRKYFIAEALVASFHSYGFVIARESLWRIRGSIFFLSSGVAAS